MMLDTAVGPLLEALQAHRTDILKTILEEVRDEIKRDEKADQTEVDRRFRAFLDSPVVRGNCLIHEAIRLDNGDAVRTLLQSGADPSILDGEGKKLLSSCNPDSDLYRVLVTAAVTAIVADDAKILRRLLDAGVSANAPDNGQRSLLHWAASCADANSIELLIWAGANVNAADESGSTPLHEALLRREESVAGCLVRAGADIHITASQGTFAGKCPLDLIRNSDHHWTSKFMSMLPISNGHHSPTATVNGGWPVENGNISHGEIAKTGEVSSAPATPITPLPTPVPQKKDKDRMLLMAQSPLPSVITDERLNQIWPQPTVIKQLQTEPIVFPKELQLTISAGTFPLHKVLDVFDLNRHLFRAAGRRIYLCNAQPTGSHAPLSGDPAEMASLCVCLREGGGGGGAPAARGGYSLHIGVTKGRRRIKLCAGDLEGLHHAVVTLAQMFQLFRDDDGLVPSYISDQPQCGVRGVLVDMNPYGRVPKFEVLGQLVELMSAFKMNQLQAFFRLSKNGVWSFRELKCEMLSIDRYCSERFIDMVPAFDVDGSVTRSNLLDLIPAVSEILSSFSQTRYIHIGPVLSVLLFSEDGINSEDHRQRLCEMLFPKAEVLYICGNGLTGDLPELPLSAVVLHYGFQKSTGFSEALGQFQDAGHHVGICTGSGAWNNIAGSPETMLDSQLAAHKAMTHLGAPGAGVSIVAHWSSDPALAHSVFAWPGIVAAAGLGWNIKGTPDDYLRDSIPGIINHHIVGEDIHCKIGDTIMELGRAEQLLENAVACSVGGQEAEKNGQGQTMLLKLLVSPDDVVLQQSHLQNFSAVISTVRRAQSALLQSLTRSDQPRSRSSSSGVSAESTPNSSPPRYSSVVDVHQESVVHELQLTAELLLLAARVGKALILQQQQQTDKAVTLDDLSPTFKTDAANKLLSLMEQFRAHWLTRYQAQGMQGSLAAMGALLAKFIPEKSEDALSHMK